MNDTHEQQAPGERELVARLGALPRAIEPAHDLWPAVQARINPAPTRGRTVLQGGLARAASLALAVLAALAAGTWIGYGYGARSALATPVRARAPEMERIELAFATARESYLRQIALRGHPLDAGERASLGSQLAVIDRAVHELRDAMAADPRNPIYIDTLLMTREREMELLADISGATLTRL